MRYENLLSRSAKILWRHPWLCLLALLAGETASSGGGGGSPPTFQRFSPSSRQADAPDLTWIPQWLSDRTILIIEVAAVVALVALAWFLISCLATGALIRAAVEFDQGSRLTFGRAWRIGAGSYWRVLGFKLVQFLLIVLPLLLLLVPPILGAAAGAGPGAIKGLLLDLPLLFAYFFWSAFVAALGVLGIRSCVLDGTGPISSFRAAYRLLKAQFPRIALTAVVFALVGFGIGIVLQLILAVVTAPLVANLTDIALRGRWSQLPGALLATAAVLVPVSVILSSIVGAYYATAWTLAYRRFAVEGQLPEPPPLA